MITTEQENFVRKFVDADYFDIKKLIAYLKLHDFVGEEIFKIVLKSENKKYRIDLVNEHYGFTAIETETFIRRVPFYFYMPNHDMDEVGDLCCLINGYFQWKKDIKNYDKLYELLEKMFYHHKISLKDIMQYTVQQTYLVNQTELLFMWGDYLDLCEELNIYDKTPKSLIYSLNLALERAGKKPIIYGRELVGYNENYIREGDVLSIGGVFPCDESGKLQLQWTGIKVIDSLGIRAYNDDEAGFNKLVKIKLGPDTKVFILDLFNYESEQNFWYPIYYGPRAMELDFKVLKTYRKKLGFTQQQVADNIKVQLRTYQKWESGETVPDGYNLIRLMNLFDISSVQEFVNDSPILTSEFEGCSFYYDWLNSRGITNDR